MASIILQPDLAYIEKALSEPLDPEREAWRAARKKFVYDPTSRMVVPIKAIGGASNLTSTVTELIYSNVSPGIAHNTFTTELQLNPAADMGPIAVLPPYFFLSSGSLSRTMRIVGRGIYSSTGSPTFTWTVRGGALGNITTAPIIGGTAALTVGATQSNLVWEFEAEAQLTVIGTALAAATLRTIGMLTFGLTASTTGGGGVWGAATQPGTVATFDISATNAINFNAACGTSSVSNAITLLQLLVFGLN